MYSLHPTPEEQNFYSVPVQGQNFKMITSAKHEGYILVWAECVARGFQTLFIMRDEGVTVIKTSGVRYQFSGAVPIGFRVALPRRNIL